MPWVRIDDGVDEDPKMDDLSDGAFRLWVAGLCFSSRNLTDGRIPYTRVSRLVPRYKPTYMQELVSCGLWIRREDTLEVKNYLDYQPSASEVEQKREYERRKKARQRQAGTANVSQDITTGRFVSRPMSPGDNNGESLRESSGESPATHPIPSPYVTNSPYNFTLVEDRPAGGKSLSDYVAGMCHGRNRGLVKAEADKVVGYLQQYVDRRLIEEAAGQAQAKNANLPRFLLPVVRSRAASYGITIPPHPELERNAS